MPSITPLKKGMLSQWPIDNQLPQSLGFSKENLGEILAEHNGFILPTIKALCKTADMEMVYQKNFQQYEYKPEEL